MPDTSGVLLVLLVALALAWLFASRSTKKKSGFGNRLRKAAIQLKTVSENSTKTTEALSLLAGRVDKIGESFAGVNGSVSRTVPWGEFQTVSLPTDDGPVWFPIGNVSHVTSRKKFDGTENDNAEANFTYNGVVHLKNGSFYNTILDYAATTETIIQARVGAFDRFVISAKKEEAK